MSVARGFGLNGKSIYCNVAQPKVVFANWVVDQTNGNACGIRALKSNGYIQNVWMNTNPSATTARSVFASGVKTITISSVQNLVVGAVVTDSTTGGNISGGTTVASIGPGNQITLSAATAGASASAPGDTLSFAVTAALVGNPNPAAGYAWVQFKNNFNYYLGGFSGFVSQLSGSNIAVNSTNLTVGNAYVITSLGTTTAANWVTLGLPLGFTPTVGQSFIAAATGAGSGTGQVQIPVATGSGIDLIDVIGDPNQSISNANIAANGGAWILMRFLAGSTLAATAPANNSVVSAAFFFDGSTVQIPDGGQANFAVTTGI
jgi:hypothetical protein